MTETQKTPAEILKKIRALEIIQELEPHKRNIYAGAIGYMAP